MSIQTLAKSAGSPPASNENLRRALYAGQVFRIDATPASRKLVAAVVALLAAEFGAEVDLRKLQFDLPNQELYERIGKVRHELFFAPELQALVFDLVAEQGFALEENAVDPARMRAVAHLGHENPAAAPAYTVHRDCWYSNPQSQINWWIPLHDVTEGETFAFFPAYFDRPVKNGSAGFDYDQFMANVGWQNTQGAKAVYPTAEEEFDRASKLPFACKAGDIILFSASHLHQTEKNSSGLMRLSVDFRSVHVEDDAASLGAPNVDNASTGSALKDYMRPVSKA
jgi:hypothetical protein